MNSKEYTLPNGKKAVFEYDICGIGKVTLECMDELMGMIADRPQGEWIADENGGCRCSVCGVREERFIYGLGEYWHGRGESNYCPNCGARMKGA